MTRSNDFAILVGVDDDPGTTAALAWATELASDQHGSVTALTAWNYPSPLMMPIVGAPTLPAEFVEAKARETLTTALSCGVAGSVSVHERVVMGGARTVLVDASKDHDLLVVGRSGKSRLRQAWIGSTANYCARHAHCPVAIIGANVEPERRWVVAVDGSEPSIQALSWALRVKGADQVVAVYSREEWELRGMASDHRVRPEVPPAVRQHFDTAIATAAAAAGVATEAVCAEIRRGDPRMTIVDDAEPGEMLVFGSHGHSGLARMLLGSVSDYAVHHAQNPIVIWRASRRR